MYIYIQRYLDKCGFCDYIVLFAKFCSFFGICTVTLRKCERKNVLLRSTCITVGRPIFPLHTMKHQNRVNQSKGVVRY